MEISRKYRKLVKFFLILENIIIIDVSTTGFMYIHFSIQLVEVNIAVQCTRGT